MKLSRSEIRALRFISIGNTSCYENFKTSIAFLLQKRLIEWVEASKYLKERYRLTDEGKVVLRDLRESEELKNAHIIALMHVELGEVWGRKRGKTIFISGANTAPVLFLEKMGLVKREESESTIRFFLTDAGRSALER